MQGCAQTLNRCIIIITIGVSIFFGTLLVGFCIPQLNYYSACMHGQKRGKLSTTTIDWEIFSIKLKYFVHPSDENEICEMCTIYACKLYIATKIKCTESLIDQKMCKHFSDLHVYKYLVSDCCVSIVSCVHQQQNSSYTVVSVLEEQNLISNCAPFWSFILY